MIPAYNEGRVIGRCLQALIDTDLDVEIVVAVNGSHDNTADAARRFAGVQVLDLPVPGKANALNEGDRAASAFPRIFLDADIVLGPGALANLIEGLSTQKPRVAAPAVRFDTSGASRLVKEYYEIYTRIPYVTEGMVGLGVYGLSQAGRSRFEAFPDLLADDLFIQRLFAPDERLTTEGWFRVVTPRTVRDLIEVRTRVARGNTALAQAADRLPEGDYAATTGSTMAAIGGLIRQRPRFLPSALIYTGVVAAGRVRSKRGHAATWNRDESSR